MGCGGEGPHRQGGLLEFLILQENIKKKVITIFLYLLVKKTQLNKNKKKYTKKYCCYLYNSSLVKWHPAVAEREKRNRRWAPECRTTVTQGKGIFYWQ